VIHCDWRVDEDASAVQTIISSPTVPTVIFCGNDLIALGAMNALEEAGVKVPEEISVIGHRRCCSGFSGTSSPDDDPRASRTTRKNGISGA
jgi:DNA-binding LacI/PurR family transcriptional regulator